MLGNTIPLRGGRGWDWYYRAKELQKVQKKPSTLWKNAGREKRAIGWFPEQHKRTKVYFDIDGANIENKRVVIELLVSGMDWEFSLGWHCSSYYAEFSESCPWDKWFRVQELYFFRCAQGRIRLQWCSKGRYMLIHSLMFRKATRRVFFIWYPVLWWRKLHCSISFAFHFTFLHRHPRHPGCRHHAKRGCPQKQQSLRHFAQTSPSPRYQFLTRLISRRKKCSGRSRRGGNGCDWISVQCLLL